MARELFHKHRVENIRFCYTDGSKTDQAVGTAFWIPSMRAKGGGSLEPWSSIVTAELMGIKLTVEWLIKHEVRGDVVIVTDSKSAVQSLFTQHTVAKVRRDCWDILTLTTQRFRDTQGKVFFTVGTIPPRDRRE